MLTIAGFLFDVDGTLIDSNDAHAGAWSEVFQENGLNVAYEKIRASIGMGGDHLLPHLISISSESPEGKTIEQRRGTIFREKYLPSLKAFEKSRELIETLNAKSYKTIVATSASSKDLKALFQQTNLDCVFDADTNSSDVERSKPDPDIIQAALHKGGFDFRRAVMVGDTPYDIEAANKAGVRAIGLTCGGWTEQALTKAGAWKVYAAPADLLTAVINGQALI